MSNVYKLTRKSVSLNVRKNSKGSYLLGFLDPDEKFKYELRFPDRTGETYSLRHSEKHKWYWYPGMSHDECLVFKCFDKRKDSTRFTFHTAFDDPSTTEASPPRQSIEVRTIAFFDEG